MATIWNVLNYDSWSNRRRASNLSGAIWWVQYPMWHLCYRNEPMHWLRGQSSWCCRLWWKFVLHVWRMLQALGWVSGRWLGPKSCHRLVLVDVSSGKIKSTHLQAEFDYLFLLGNRCDVHASRRLLGLVFGRTTIHEERKSLVPRRGHFEYNLIRCRLGCRLVKHKLAWSQFWCFFIVFSALSWRGVMVFWWIAG